MDHKAYVAKAVAYKVYKAKQEETKNEQVNLYRAVSINGLKDALEDIKEAGRTPLIVSSEESQITNKAIIQKLQ